MSSSRGESDTASQAFSRSATPTLSGLPRRRASARHTLDDATHPPRYSRLVVSDPASGHEDLGQDVFYLHAVESDVSFRTLGLNITSPTYTTLPRPGDGTTVLPGSSITTSPDPPGYSPDRLTRDFTRNTARPGEFLSTIKSSGFKSRTWATLRLYDLYPNAQVSRAGRYARYSDQDNILGNVELSLAGAQTIKSIQVVLKGSIITSSSIDGSTLFLEHTYPIWDRKFGDPRLGSHPQPEGDHKYDGKLEGGWIFPFSIPFPTHTDLSTLSAVYPPGKTPVPLPPQAIEPESPITPFGCQAITSPESPAAGRRPSPDQGQPRLITPFPMDPLSPEKAPLSSDPVPRGGQPLQAHITPFFSDGASLRPPFQSTLGLSAVTPYIHTQSPTVCPPANETATKVRPPGERTTSCNPKFEKRQHRNSPGFNTNEGPPSGPSHAHNQPALKKKTSTSLPQSFLERDVKPTIQYELILLISHGVFSSDRVKSTIIYNPTSRPPPMPLSRRSAYERNSLLPNPIADPSGWRKLEPISIEGFFLHQRNIKVEYILYLAEPLSYGRGTNIPCYLTIKCDDKNALNLLSAPRSPCIRLRRFIRFLANTSQSKEKLPVHDDLFGTSEFRGGLPGVALKLSTQRATSILQLTSKRGNKSLRTPVAFPGDENLAPESAGFVRQDNSEGSDSESDQDDEYEIVNRATWWINTGSGQFTQEPTVRHLQGEIHLPKNLQPTCRFPLFSIMYSVEVLAPTIEGFEPDTAQRAPFRQGKASAGEQCSLDHTYASQRVEITTDLRDDEPFPITYTVNPPNRSDRLEPNTRLAQ